MKFSSTVPRLHVERLMLRPSIAVHGESMATYALVKVIPGRGASPSPPLHVSLAINVSGSMYEEDGTGQTRLQRVRQALIDSLQLLRPSDRVSLVAFANGGAVLLSSTAVSEIARVRAALRCIEHSDVDTTGTSMAEGIRLALQEAIGLGPTYTAYVIVLTDGETTGEDDCRALARSAAESGARLSLMGLGDGWNPSLLLEMAQLTGGRWYHLSTAEPHSALRAFTEELGRLADAGFPRAQLFLRTVRDVRIKRVRRVSPEIEEVPFNSPGDRRYVVRLGELQSSRSSSYLIDLSLPRRPDGDFVVAEAEIRYRSAAGRDEATGLEPHAITYDSKGQGDVNAGVARHIDEVQVFELTAALGASIGAGDVAETRRLAGLIAHKGELLGPRGERKAALAQRLLEELDATGTANRQTRLALMDAARRSAERPGVASTRPQL